jgi:large subunit ribosomal protein L4
MLKIFSRTVQLKRFSTAASQVTIPSNLQLGDNGRIFKPVADVKKVEMDEEEFYFPPLQMKNSSLPVKYWGKPGEVVGGDEGTINLDPRVFNVSIRKDIVHDMIRYQRAKLRQPKRTKRVGEISGSTRKPFPQKGQGRSQVGNTRNSSWRKGMKAHGPVLRDYSHSLNRKYRARALMTVLAAMHKQGDLHVFDDFDMESPKSKELINRIFDHGLLEKTNNDNNDSDSSELEEVGPIRRVMLCSDEMSTNMIYAARNLQQVILMPQVRINCLDLMRFDVLAISKTSLNALMERLIVQHQYGSRNMFYLQQHTLMNATDMIDGLKEIKAFSDQMDENDKNTIAN